MRVTGRGQGVSLNFFADRRWPSEGLTGEKVQDASPPTHAPSRPLPPLGILEMSLEEAKPLDAWFEAAISEHHDLILCERRSIWRVAAARGREAEQVAGYMRIWLMAARPRTLPAAIAPVLVGTAAAVYWAGSLPRVGAFFAALVGSIFIQIGTNLANDYSDAKRGADTADRLGPVRVTSAGLVTPRRVLNATWIAFAVAVVCGIYLATVAGLVILVIGAFSIAAGVLYTGGPRPYGYAGLGEVFVFLFFGLVAVNGSFYVQVEELDALPLGLSIALGFLATAILVVNNVRDMETDRRAGKMTMAVRMGRHNAVVLYRCLVLGAFVVLPLALLAGEASALPLIGLLALPLAIGPMRAMTNRTDGPSLNAALAGTGALLGAYSLLVAAGLLLAS